MASTREVAQHLCWRRSTHWQDAWRSNGICAQAYQEIASKADNDRQPQICARTLIWLAAIDRQSARTSAWKHVWKTRKQLDMSTTR